MKAASGLFVVLALLTAAGAAQAQSPIPGNNVTDFGPFHYANPAPPSDRPAAHCSPISPNNVDDFGPLVSETSVAAEHLGAAGAEPGAEAKVAERAQEKAALAAAAQERFLRESWTNP